MAPAVIMAIASAVQAVAPLIKSGIQKHRLKQLGDAERPDFQIPEAADEQLGLARSIASNRNMPGYDEALDKIDNQTNRAIGDVKAAGGNMQDVMAAMAAANVGAGMQKRDLSIANDRSYLGTLQNLQGQLGTYANWQNAQQQDEMKKYNDEMARRAALETAGQQNKQAGIGAISQGIAQYGGYQMNMDMMDKQYQNNLSLQNAGFDKMLSSTAMQNMPTDNNQVNSYNAAAATLGASMQSLIPGTINQPNTTNIQPQINQPINPMQATSLEMPNAGMAIAPQLQNNSSVVPQDQTPFNMLTPDQQQKKLLELMMLSGVIK